MDDLTKPKRRIGPFDTVGVGFRVLVLTGPWSSRWAIAVDNLRRLSGIWRDTKEDIIVVENAEGTTESLVFLRDCALAAANGYRAIKTFASKNRAMCLRFGT
jgi:hypothetical protein